ncbi:conserved hypothetical protein [Verrucomicrobia bacterium]|nr:conserved hypothetical protein [Verrucomicrobiota bacterium]
MATACSDNPRFGWRFFPHTVARAPRPQFLAARKTPGTVRILVLGESAAMGDPEPSFGFARQLERMLQARHLDQNVEVINAAMTAISSHVMRQIAHDSGPLGADFWLIYAGNNEVIGPYGAGTVFGPQAPGLGAVRFALALKTTRLGQLLAALGERSGEPMSWEGLELFLAHQVQHDDQRLARVYSNFAGNLASVVDFGRQSGAEVLLATMPVNLEDSPPFASLHRTGLGAARLAEWEKSFARGTAAEQEGRFTEALAAYQQAAAIDEEFAELIFRRARCERALHQDTAATADFQLACDLDTMRFRADSRLNQVIRRIGEAQGISLADAREEIARRGGALPSEDFFYDHVHLNGRGNYLLATLFAAEIEKTWPGRPESGPLLDEMEVARRLAFTDFDRHRIGEEMRARLRQPPFSSQCNFQQRDQEWGRRLETMRTPASELIPAYRTALALAPQDWMLHANFAALLRAAAEVTAAAAEWQQVARLAPFHPQAWLNLGQLAHDTGDNADAERFLRQGLELKPESAEICTELGAVRAAQGDLREARRLYEAALQYRPGFSAALLNLGLLLAHNGDSDDAAARYREVLRWHTNNVEARIDLANLLANEGRSNQALTLYQEAAQLEPQNPAAAYSLGKALFDRGSYAQAVPLLQGAARQRPDLPLTRYELGIALARVGKDREALQEFEAAARLKPDLVEARFNYGVALAKCGRYAEAGEEFRETLRLEPNHPFAQRFLDQVARTSGEKK